MRIINLFFYVLMAVSLNSFAQNSKDRLILGEETARRAVKNALSEKDYKPFYDTLIKDKETAIAVVEPILFKTYGKKNIISERPYECYLIDGYWYICGTLPKHWDGGVFEIIMSAKDAKVLKLIHGR